MTLACIQSKAITAFNMQPMPRKVVACIESKVIAISKMQTVRQLRRHPEQTGNCQKHAAKIALLLISPSCEYDSCLRADRVGINCS